MILRRLADKVRMGDFYENSKSFFPETIICDGNGDYDFGVSTVQAQEAQANVVLS